MRVCILLLFGAALAFGQTKPQFRGPAMQSGHGERPHSGPRVGRVFGGGWWTWPGWWTSSFDQTPLRPPVDPPKEQPLLLRNPDYSPVRMEPAVRDYPEGALPAPKIDRQSAAAAAACRLREASGVESDALDCQVTDDTVRWRSADGRWHRATLDLAWPVTTNR